MKLLYCKKCEDIIRLTYQVRKCECGRTTGRYIDGLNAIYSGNNAVPLGIGYTTFLTALNNIPKEGMGKTFSAFVIPKECDTIKRVLRREVEML